MPFSVSQVRVSARWERSQFSRSSHEHTHRTRWALPETLRQTKVSGPVASPASYRVRVGAIMGEESAPGGAAQPGGPRIREAGQRAGPLGTAGDNLRCSGGGLSGGAASSKQRGRGSRRAARSLGARCLKTALGPAMKWRSTPFRRNPSAQTHTRFIPGGPPWEFGN